MEDLPTCTMYHKFKPCVWVNIPYQTSYWESVTLASWDDGSPPSLGSMLVFSVQARTWWVLQVDASTYSVLTCWWKYKFLG